MLNNTPIAARKGTIRKGRGKEKSECGIRSTGDANEIQLE
jgi:hypothetical protein